jgi:hypothetical protein
MWSIQQAMVGSSVIKNGNDGDVAQIRKVDK